jgi:hypothetical protein
MSDEPTLSELARLIERNHQETRGDIASLHQRLDRDLAYTNGRIDQAVAMNVYEADKRGTDLRFKNVEDDVAGMRATTRWAVGLAVTSLIALLSVAVPLLVR